MRTQLTGREKKIFIVCVLLLGIYLTVQFLIRPMREQDSALNRAILESKQSFKKNLRVLADGKTADAKYKQYLELFGPKGSDESEVSTMLSEVESSAGRAKVQITNMQPLRVVKEEAYKKIGVQVVIDGPLASVVAFIHELQVDPYFFNLEEIQLEKSFAPEVSVRGRVSLSKFRLKLSN